MYLRLFRYLFVGASFFIVQAVLSAEVSTFGSASNVSCYLKGQIGPRDLESFQKVVATCNSLMLDSAGGDLRTAMRIGRLVRKGGLGTTVPISGQCASACAFVYAGGVTRVNYGPVRIHRPYLVNDNASSWTQTQKKYEELGREARQYLREMNVRESLYDAMLAIPPENSYTLGVEEMEGYGMGRNDPVWAEALDNTIAKRMGISKLDYLELKARVGRLCGELAPIMTRETYECWKQHAPSSFAE